MATEERAKRSTKQSQKQVNQSGAPATASSAAETSTKYDNIQERSPAPLLSEEKRKLLDARDNPTRAAVEKAPKEKPVHHTKDEEAEATEKALARLRQSVQDWNRWRKAHPDMRPKLAGAQLSGLDLRGANLSGVNLSGADLSRANLSMADLSNANLSGADLRWANLTGANLQGADLSNAFLTNARLIDVTLINTQFRNSDLRGVIFDNTSFTRTVLEGAHLYRTVFGDVDLSAAQGLEHVRHWGPSLLGLEAIARSKGSLPLAFLRGVGVPEPLLPQNSTPASSFPHLFSLAPTITCFISYAQQDQIFANALEADLQQRGVRCWLDPDHTKKGEIRSRVDDKLLIVLSKHSLGSAWLSEEIEFFLQKQAQREKRLLFLLSLDDTAIEAPKKSRHFMINFTRWQDPLAYSEALSQLLSELKTVPTAPHQ